MTQVALTSDMMDFSVTREPIRFRVDDDVFEAPPDLPAELALRFASEAERLEDDGAGAAVEVLHNLFRLILRPASAERFIARLSDTTAPIGVETFQRVVEWLLEQYGLRPTESDSASSAGFSDPATGTS